MGTSENNIPPQAQQNAVISYFFLGILFLLAKKDPKFSHPFTQSHARYATLIHLGFIGGFVAFFAFNQYLKQTLFGISIHYVIYTLFFLFLLTVLLLGVTRALSFRSPFSKNAKNKESSSKGHLETQKVDGESEREKLLSVLSYVPFLGIIINQKYSSTYTQLGVRVGSIVGLILILFAASAKPGHYWGIFFVLLAYIAFLVAQGVWLFVYNDRKTLTFSKKIPPLSNLYTAFLTLPGYSYQVLQIIFGKEKDLDFQSEKDKTQEMLEKSDGEYLDVHVNKKHPFSPYVIWIPILNIIYLPRLILKKDCLYRRAYAQGFVTTIIFLLGVFFGSDLVMMLILFPVFLGLATVEKNPEYRVPIIFEIAQFIHWLFSREKKPKEEKTVSYTIKKEG